MRRRRKPHPGQLDLFVDSDSTVLVNDIIAALLRRDRAAALNGLDQLRNAQPSHGRLTELAQLCAALDYSAPALAQAADLTTEIRQLETIIEPRAQSILGKDAGTYMDDFWRALADAAGELPFDPQWPDASAAALYLRCGRYREAAEAVAAIAGWADDPDCLRLRVLAEFAAAGLEGCRPALLRLALLAPRRLRAVIGEIGHPGLQKEWRTFLDSCDRFAADDDSAPAWFPAWYRLRHAGLQIPREAVPESAPPAAQALVLVDDLLRLERSGLSPALLKARKQLRDLHPQFYDYYLHNRAESANELG